MPHIIAEYSDGLQTSEDIPKLLAALHESLSAQDTIDINAIKTRAHSVHYPIVGDGHGVNKMIHITLKLLPGRDDALKHTMAQGLADTAREKTHDDRIVITVETTELHAESYIK